MSKLIAYLDGEDIVLCEPNNPRAWIRSDTMMIEADAGAERTEPDTA